MPVVIGRVVCWFAARMAFWVEEEGRAREDEPPAWRERDIIVKRMMCRMSRKDGMVEIY